MSNLINRNKQLSLYCDYCKRQTLHAKEESPETSPGAGCLIVLFVLFIAGFVGQISSILGIIIILGGIIAAMYYRMQPQENYRCQTCGSETQRLK